MQYLNKAQIAFGQRLGIDLTGKSVGEALAMIEDVIQRDFLSETDLGAPTPKQVELAAKFQRDISGASRRVGNAIINDLMTDLNHEAIRREKLAPGVAVINKHDQLKKSTSFRPSRMMALCIFGAATAQRLGRGALSEATIDWSCDRKRTSAHDEGLSARLRSNQVEFTES